MEMVSSFILGTEGSANPLASESARLMSYLKHLPGQQSLLFSQPRVPTSARPGPGHSAELLFQGWVLPFGKESVHMAFESSAGMSRMGPGWWHRLVDDKTWFVHGFEPFFIGLMRFWHHFPGGFIKQSLLLVAFVVPQGTPHPWELLRAWVSNIRGWGPRRTHLSAHFPGNGTWEIQKGEAHFFSLPRDKLLVLLIKQYY